ncbi:MAG: hypothetical protein AB9897_08200 [Anaerolineaceae bacterium]
MKIVSNDKMIKRNNRIGQIASISALVILAVGMFYSFKDTQGAYMTLTFAALILGFILFQIGNYFLNRWGKSPRPDEILSQSLKGLDDKYSLYHYSTEIPHLLIGPAGIFTFLPYSQGGNLFFDAKKKQWRQKGGSIFLKVFAQESLGKPTAEADYAKEQLERFLIKLGVKVDQAKGTALLVFTNPKAEIDGTGSPTPFVTAEKLKDYIRKQAKEVNLAYEPIIELIEKKK